MIFAISPFVRYHQDMDKGKENLALQGAGCPILRAGLARSVRLDTKGGNYLHYAENKPFTPGSPPIKVLAK